MQVEVEQVEVVEQETLFLEVTEVVVEVLHILTVIHQDNQTPEEEVVDMDNDGEAVVGSEDDNDGNSRDHQREELD